MKQVIALVVLLSVFVGCASAPPKLEEQPRVVLNTTATKEKVSNAFLQKLQTYGFSVEVVNPGMIQTGWKQIGRRVFGYSDEYQFTYTLSGDSTTTTIVGTGQTRSVKTPSLTGGMQNQTWQPEPLKSSSPVFKELERVAKEAKELAEQSK